MFRRHRYIGHHVEALQIKFVVLCTLFHLTTCGPCTMTEIQNPLGYDECGSYRNDLGSASDDVFVDDNRKPIAPRNSIVGLQNVCRRSDLFCFPSTLPGFFTDVHGSEANVSDFSGVKPDEKLAGGTTISKNNFSWSSNYGSFRLLSERVVSCSLELKEGISNASYCRIDSSDQNDVLSCRQPSLDTETRVDENEESLKIKSVVPDDFSSLHVQINPPLLDWGQKYLYSPSLAFLSVENTHSHSVLNIYEPYSNNEQFYPCNFSEIMLAPGETASVCFVFLPTWLGLSSAHLILQTSSGGFLIQARGFAVESPYGIQPLVGLDYSSGGTWSKHISLSNPFNEMLHVKEVSAWISFSSGNTSYSITAACSVDNLVDSSDSNIFGVKDWIDVKSQVGQPVMEMRPHRTWEVGPKSNQIIFELEFPYCSQGKIFGSFCFRLMSASRDKFDTFIVPLEAEFGGRSISDDVNSPLSIFLELLVPCDASGTTTVTLLVENAGPYLLTVVRINAVGENTESFQTKYVEGLILFPGTVTQVAVVTYTPFAIQLLDHASPIPWMNMNCKLFVETNTSDTHKLEIPCSDIVSACSQSRTHDNSKTRSTDSYVQFPLGIKAVEMAEAEDLVLGNWRSQGTESGMSVLDDDEVLFQLVHVGTHQSKWISVKNPSDQPVIMQLILNSGEIIDECRGSDGVLQPSSSSSLVRSDYTTPSRYGFSIAESALTEAYVHPHGRAFLGPIFFLPSSRCVWRSSALVRNNLSGVEWLSLRGFGGSLSLILFEGSDPVQTIEFKDQLPSSLNFSHPDILFNMGDLSHVCGRPATKVLFAKNAGDLPLEVNRIEVSGTECGLDGFVVHTCQGFALQPGESTKLIVSYRADFSAAVVQRDLELALSGGILVVPMKASLPASMLMICKRSLLWIKLKKFFVAILVAGLLISVVCSCMFSQVVSFVSEEFLFRGGKCSRASVGHEEHSSAVHCSRKDGSKLALPTKMNGFSRSIDERETLMQEYVARYPDSSEGPSKPGKTAPSVNERALHHVQRSFSLEAKNEVSRSSSSLASKSLAVERLAAGEASQFRNLTVNIGKEKGRRRKKKKSSGTGLMGQCEVSSSHSGNSTPSSPLSPVSSFTPNRSRELSPEFIQRVENKSTFTHMADRVWQRDAGNVPSSGVSIFDPKASMKYGSSNLVVTTTEKPSTLGKTVSRPFLLPSSTFPSSHKSTSNLTWPLPAASTQNIAPHARAPGSELYERKAVKAEENSGNVDKFKYDIWGDHLGLRLTCLSKEASVMSPLAEEISSDSFFARGPQSLLTTSQAQLNMDWRKPSQTNSVNGDGDRRGLLVLLFVNTAKKQVWGAAQTA